MINCEWSKEANIISRHWLMNMLTFWKNVTACSAHFTDIAIGMYQMEHLGDFTLGKILGKFENCFIKQKQEQVLHGTVLVDKPNYCKITNVKYRQRPKEIVG